MLWLSNPGKVDKYKHILFIGANRITTVIRLSCSVGQILKSCLNLSPDFYAQLPSSKNIRLEFHVSWGVLLSTSLQWVLVAHLIYE